MSEDTRQDWRLLFKVAAVGAFAVVVFIPVQMAVYVLWTPPESVAGWFALFRSNALAGLLAMDLLLVVDYVMMAVIVLALWSAMRRYAPSLTAIALLLQVLGTATYAASTVCFEMLTLSNRHAEATNEAQRLSILAAGESMIATWQGTAFNVSYLLGAIALLLMSCSMFRTRVFTKGTACLGLIASLLMFVPPTVPTIGMFFSFGSLLPTIPWLFLIGLTFRRLAVERSRAF